mgnify:CR=1 FL=1
MKHSVANGEATSLAALTRSPDYGARVIDILPVIGDADSTESVVALFRAAVTGLGALEAMGALETELGRAAELLRSSPKQVAARVE